MTFTRSDLEPRIRRVLAGVGGAPLRQGMTRLLAVLGYRSDRIPMLGGVSSLLELGGELTDKQRGLLKSMSETCALFQFTTDELPTTDRGFRQGGARSYPESLLFLAAELTPWAYSRWDLAYMTRIVNRIFAIPVIVMYRYRYRASMRPVLAVAVVHRRAHKRDAGRDVLEHVAFAKDIKFDNPSPGDLEVLAGLSLDRWIRMSGVHRLRELHLAWERTLWSTRAMNSLDSYQLYVRDLARYPMFASPAVEREIARKARAGDRHAAGRLVTANLRFVIYEVKKYRNRGLDLAELVCIGNEGLLKAVKKFDPDKGVKFISYAVWWIRQTVRQALAEQTRSVRIPLNQNSNLVKLDEVETALTQELGHTPTDREIAEQMEESVEIVRALRWVASPEVSFDAPFHESDPESLPFAERLCVMDDADIEEGIENQARREFLEKMFERYLTERERKILVLYYGLDDGEEMTLEEIGSLLGVTRERIRQIRNRAFGKLRASPTGEALEGFWRATA